MSGRDAPAPETPDLCRHELARTHASYFLPSLRAPLWPRMPCRECELKDHQDWVAQVAGKLRAALAATAQGRLWQWGQTGEDPSPYRFGRMSDLLWSSDCEHWHVVLAVDVVPSAKEITP